MGWIEKIPPLSPEVAETLARWALGRQPHPLSDEFTLDDFPRDVIEQGIPAVVAHAIAHRDDDVVKFLASVHKSTEPSQPHAARAIDEQTLSEGSWKRRFAAGALMALDDHHFPDDLGVFQGLETARGALISPATLPQISLGTDFEEALPMKASPFSQSVVLETLDRLDRVVAYQNGLDDWLPILATDIERLGDCAQVVKVALGRFNTLQTMSGPVATRLITSMRALMEHFAGRQQVNEISRLVPCLAIIACRHGTTIDVVETAHRLAFTSFLLNPDQATQLINAHQLEHLLTAAYRLDAPEFEATVHHGLGLILRSGGRKIPGVDEAVGHMERSIAIRRSLGETVAAIGTQIDLSAIYIQFGPMLAMLEGTNRSAEDLSLIAEAYLQGAIDELSTMPPTPVTQGYLGEAFHNLARLYQTRGNEQAAADNALAALGLAEAVADQDLEARANLILGEVSSEPSKRLEHQNAAAALVQEIRRGIADEDLAVAWVGNKESAFSTQIDFLLGEAREVLDEQDLCDALMVALEEGRALTYNRWLGVAEPFNPKAVYAALESEADTVLAAYAIGQQRAGVVVLAAGEQPRLHALAISPAEIITLIDGHLAGLKQQGDVRNLPLWSVLQRDFTERGAALVEPLEPYAKAGKTLCIVPHGRLHAAAFHTLSGDATERPLGLRVPVYSNPSLTNWLECRQRPLDRPSACLAVALPETEQARFTDLTALELAIKRSDYELRALTSRDADLDALSGPWGILHVVCHGLFRQARSHYGLLIAAGEQAPPRALGSIPSQTLEKHLATPPLLREHKVAGKLTFLSSCVSARNEEMPGDDLMGVTRSMFAGGAVNLIAGAWTVNSDYVLPFAEAFYDSLGDGFSAARALERARSAVAEQQQDPFFWGAFVMQGADIALSKGA